MNNNKECAQYFKDRSEYQRCFKELRSKWKSYGKVSGKITLHYASEEERRAIGGILGKAFDDGDIRFSFAEFEQGLQRTRFAPVDMQEVLEEYFGETMSTNQAQKKEELEKRKEFLEGICEHFSEHIGSESAAFLWLQNMIASKKYGYQILIREYARDRQQAETLARNVGNALMKLETAGEAGNGCPLAVFAAGITGNPHYFDRGTTAGLLFVHALCYCEKTELPENAHQWREMLWRVGIVPDNISSMVHAYGLRLRTKDDRHPAYDAFCSLKEPYVITMENLKGITGAQAAGDRVYVVENEMVFSYLLESAQNNNLTLLCTSGQLRTVAMELIPLILNSGALIYYSGDIDPDGIGIADRLWQKFGDRIHIWRMSPADYEKSISGESIGDTGMAKLAHIKNPLLEKTAECIRKKGMAGYQENILEDLLKDITSS